MPKCKQPSSKGKAKLEPQEEANLKISSLTLEEDLQTIISLPRPEDSPLATAKTSELIKTARMFRRQLFAVLEREFNLPEVGLPMTCPNCGKTGTLSKEKIFARLLLCLLAYYDFAISKMKISSFIKAKQVPLTLDDSSKLIDKARADINELMQAKPSGIEDRDIEKIDATHFVADYSTCLFLLTLLEAFPFRPDFQEKHDLYFSAVKKLMDLHKKAIPLKGDLRILGNYLISSLLNRLGRTFRNSERSWDISKKKGIFSSIDLSELILLAQRDNRVMKKYGKKQVEKVFERQVALVAQSLGFYVVSTRTGERTVDLICIPADPRVHATILIEAKTTKSSYALPAKDERALLEYVEDFRNILTTLPPLRFALLIGPEPGKKMQEKLRKLEIKSRLPIKYCTAAVLSSLRESIAGPVPMEAFFNAILAGPQIVAKNLPKTIAATYEATQNAHSSFVQSLYSAHRFIQPSKEQWVDVACNEEGDIQNKKDAINN